ncbi:MAG: N-acetylmuramoyl-L-alanine amidase, partial [Firmicutes bacterium]|nr:N-acetylmuramoyl-L-alanine amidase [Bacillota bacterium]
MSDQVLLLQADANDDNHGLAPGIQFVKYEIAYNKYDYNVVEYIVVHDTGNSAAGSNAMAHYRYFAGGDRQASAHYFVDSTMVVQIIDDSEGSWHCGAKYKTYATPISNHNSIGIEMCINSDGDYNQAVQNTIDLCAYLLWKYDLPIERLVRHYDANGKTCPLTMSANNWEIWNEVVAAVKAKLATYGAHNSSG